MTVETGPVDRPRGGGLRWLTSSWWFIALPMAVLALSDVREHTFARYATGRLPQTFGIQLNVHADIPLMLLLLAVMLAAVLWLIVGAVTAMYRLATRRPHPMLNWQVLALAIALGLPFVPAGVWDELLLRTVGPGKAGGDLLATAAGRGDIARLQRLIDRGIAVDAENRAHPADSPALWVAVRDSRPEAVAFLLERGADPNRASHYGAIPLIGAVRAGDATIVRALVARGADSCASETHWRGTSRQAQVSAWSLAQEKRKPEILAILPACPASASPNGKP